MGTVASRENWIPLILLWKYLVAEAVAGYVAEQFSEVEFTSDVGDAVSAALNIDTSLAAFCAALTAEPANIFLEKSFFGRLEKSK